MPRFIDELIALHLSIILPPAAEAQVLSTMPSPPEFELSKTLHGHTDSVNFVSFSPDGAYLASGDDNGFLQIFNTKTFKPIRKFSGVSAVRALVWHLSWKGTFIVGSRNGDVNTIQMGKVRAVCPVL